MGWNPVPVSLLGECWTVCLDVRKLPLWQPARPDSLIPEWCAGSMSRDLNATQTAGFHFQRWCHELNKFPVYQHQQVTGGGGGWVWGVKTLFPFPPFCGILIWFTAQFPPDVCACSVCAGIFAWKEEADEIRCGGRQQRYPNTDLSRGFCTAGKPTSKAPTSNPRPLVRTVSSHFLRAQRKQTICLPLEGDGGSLTPF